MILLGYKTKFDSITRAVAAIGIGLVMIFGSNAPTLVVKIIAGLLIVAGIASLVYGLLKQKEVGMYQVLIINAGLDIILGLLLFFNPQWVAGFIVFLIGIALIVFGALQLIVLAGAMSLLGSGFSSLILSACAIIGGAFLLFNPFSLKIMSIIAGCFLVLYGISELISTFKMVEARKEYEIRRAPASTETPAQGRIDTSGIGDAREVEFERIDDPDDLDDMN
ncbi:MAG: DUF308 domain-containing protein [Bacteroidales bacterium]|nr:DUF308 domain-containing protein [Bacteroidales bacterium]